MVCGWTFRVVWCRCIFVTWSCLWHWKGTSGSSKDRVEWKFIKNIFCAFLACRGDFEMTVNSRRVTTHILYVFVIFFWDLQRTSPTRLSIAYSSFSSSYNFWLYDCEKSETRFGRRQKGHKIHFHFLFHFLALHSDLRFLFYMFFVLCLCIQKWKRIFHAVLWLLLTLKRIQIRFLNF